jgi:uncharacterized membrane protein YheB (UPF0754 family)
LAYCLAAGLVVTRVAGFHDGGLRFQHRRPERPTFLALGAARSARASVGYPVVRLHATAEEEEEGEGEGAQEGGESRDVDPSSSSRESTSFSSSLAAAAAAVSLPREEEEEERVNVFRRAGRRFRASPVEHLLIPVIAACVGWITNKLAVDMIFYPLSWTGIPIWRFPGNPFGLIGWQGIVPAKAAIMSGRIVDMVTTKLIDVPSVFRRLDPAQVATLMEPEVELMASSIASEALPATLRRFLKGLGGLGLGLQSDSDMVRRLRAIERQMLEGLTRDMQRNLNGILDVRALVVEELSRDKRVLVNLFKKVGAAELRFLVNSGWYFGFLLGVIQMVAWMFCRSNWTLPLGGAVVGCLTNWFALKFIFEPVDPVPIFGGRFVLQGLFLKRQPEVSAEFAEYMSANVLTSKKLWDSILHGPKCGRFYDLLDVRLRRAMTAACGVLKVGGWVAGWMASWVM